MILKYIIIFATEIKIITVNQIPFKSNNKLF